VTPEDEAAALLGRLVAIPSVNPGYRSQGTPAEWYGEAAMSEAVAGWLREIGLPVELDEVSPGRSNVIARLRGPGARRRLLWEGHTDTVQATGMTIPPFEPSFRDGRLYGRGAVDDKGCLVAFMLALRELARDPPPLDLTFVAAVDEEFTFTGISHYMARGEPADGGVAGEPTGLRVVTACKGAVRWDIEVIGRGAHSSRPEEGIDAITIATDLSAHLRRVFGPRYAAHTHPLLGRRTLVTTFITGGEGVNTVPARCAMKYDRRTLPDETGMEAWHEIEAEVASFAKGLDGAARVVMHPPFLNGFSMEVPGESPVAAAARATCAAEGLDDQIIGVPFGSDASKMTRSGVPTIIFGPGSIDQAHTADEYVEIAQVTRAARMLADMARRFPDA
jgi:acetylornithine deacetylase